MTKASRARNGGIGIEAAPLLFQDFPEAGVTHVRAPAPGKPEDSYENIAKKDVPKHVLKKAEERIQKGVEENGWWYDEDTKIEYARKTSYKKDGLNSSLKCNTAL